MMNNRVPRRSSSTPRPLNTLNRQANTSNYMVYLFFISFISMILIPYVVPWMGLFQRTSKNTQNGGSSSKPRENLKDDNQISSSMPQSYANSPFQRPYLTDVKYDALESLILDIQRVVQMERERTVKLENDVRILELSERFLKERLQMVEDRNTLVQEPPKASSFNSLEIISQSSDDNINYFPTIEELLKELKQAVQTEKERMNAMDMEIGKLKMSESNLKDRMELLELKFSAFIKTSESLHLPRFVST